MATYAYNKLDALRREIRLCTLLPGSLEEPVTCVLSIVSLDDKPEYESLSYAWGSPIFDKEIVIHDCVHGSGTPKPGNETAAGNPPAPALALTVTTSLYTAFRYLRKSDQTRVIWADAVCINQIDLDERSAQVSIMGDIYTAAKSCQIWLGTVEDVIDWPDEKVQLNLVTRDDISNFEKLTCSQGTVTAPRQLPTAGSATISPNDSILGALHIVQNLLENKHLYQMPFWRFRETSATNIYFVGTWYKCLRTLLSIVSRPWWERIWGVQEAVLSPNAILNIGQHQVLLKSFLSASQNYAAHSEACCKIWTGPWHGQEEISLPFLAKMRVVKDLGRVMADYAANRLVPISLALMSRERKATNPRDHFYAITGLMKNPISGIPLGPTPDYRLDPEQLFREQTLNLMQQSNSINLLDYAIGVGNPNPLSLPSWVCDWSEFKLVAWLSSLYNASNGHKHQFQQTPDSSFAISGAEIDVVSKLGDLVDPDNAEDIAVKVEEWKHLAGTHQTFDIATVLRATFFDVIMSKEGEYRRLNARDGALIGQWWWQWILRKKRRPQIHEDPDVFFTNSHFRYQMKRDRVFATREGHLGVGPRTIAVGDRIFIVKGARVPFSLRNLDGNSVDESSPQICGDYSYVGRCYLHGCMDGEAIAPETEWQTLNLH